MESDLKSIQPPDPYPFSEYEIVKKLYNAFPEFIGNDTATLPQIPSEHQYVISKDLLIEDVHFRTSYFSPQDLAHKALQVNLSDLAASGAQPSYILCGIGIPVRLRSYAQEFLTFLTALCKQIGIILMGGDTTRSQNHLFISITVIGHARSDRIKSRKNAALGDIICVVGELGFAHLGFLGLEKSIPTEARYLESFLRPKAKIQEGQWLAKQRGVSSMMDISDGLYADLKQLCTMSIQGATLDIDLLRSHLVSDVSTEIALTGGEDYGLLVTISPRWFVNLFRDFRIQFGYNLKAIGHISHSKGVVIKRLATRVEINTTPFSHF